MLKCLLTIGTAIGMSLITGVTGMANDPTQFPEWKNGLPSDDDYLPIGVWLQSPHLAQQYQNIGVNLYVGLWQGPTEEQLTQLYDADMPVIAPQNEYARQLLAGEGNTPLLDTIVGWAQEDEPDNAQRADGGGWDPPITPEEIQSRYDEKKSHDDTRPVYLNLGQGVAWDGWGGRGVRTEHPEDYPEYAKGADIVSFDVYPAASDGEIAGKLWRVGYGTKRLREWAADDQPVWTFVETTRIHGAGKATPDEVRAMVWMGLTNGATGIQYFVHEWDADGNMVSSSQLLNDEEMRNAVAEINAEVQSLAPVINQPSITQGVTVSSTTSLPERLPIDKPINWMLKEYDGVYYLFVVSNLGKPTAANFDLTGVAGIGDHWHIEVLGEDNTLQLDNGTFSEDLGAWDVRLYRIVPEPNSAAALGAMGLLAMWRNR